jgi:hypothetical protein
MMSAIDATAALAKANAELTELTAPTDQSLNAGALLPDEPIADTLTNEVAGDADVILEMLPKLNQEPTAATESIFNDLRYLRSDLVTQRGMSQRIATEAIALLPNFGKGRPVNFYSRHPSPTGLKMAQEEIEAGMQSDLLAQIAGQISRLEMAAANPGNGYVVENLDFKRRADQVSMQGDILSDFINTLAGTEFSWDDATFRAAAIDPSQNGGYIPSLLMIDTKVPHSFATMDDYYQAHLDAPSMLETMTTHLVKWRVLFSQVLDAMKGDAETVKVDTPSAPSVYFGFGGKTTSIENIGDVFQTAADKMKEPDPSVTNTLSWVKNTGNAAQQARVEDILIRAKAYAFAAGEVSAVLKDISEYLLNGPNVGMVELMYKLISAFAKSNIAMSVGYTEMIKWCVNAGIATSYAGLLAAKVGEIAWRSVNQCKDTMQMDEATYERLKNMVEDLAAPIKTNAL